MIVSATSKSVRISPKKAREVAALLRGHKVEDALVILEHTPRRAAKHISKVISSAKANATHNHSMNESNLIISSVEINEAGSYKRWRPAARGRALTYRHKLIHIKVVVEGEEAKKTPSKAKKATPKTEINAKENQ